MDETGQATVEFPAPGAPFGPFDTTPHTVSRAEVSEAAEASPPPATTGTPSSQDGAAPAPEGGAGAPAVNMDELAENVIDRLRRELLIEREQSGGPMDLM
jgi:hypothetical protein